MTDKRLNRIILAIFSFLKSLTFFRLIFIFGFSRGAYTAHSLAGLISRCGVYAPATNEPSP